MQSDKDEQDLRGRIRCTFEGEHLVYKLTNLLNISLTPLTLS